MLYSFANLAVTLQEIIPKDHPIILELFLILFPPIILKIILA